MCIKFHCVGVQTKKLSYAIRHCVGVQTKKLSYAIRHTKMNKKRFVVFSQHLESFTQKIMSQFPTTADFIENEKRDMAEKFPELLGDFVAKPTRDKKDIFAMVAFTLKKSVNPERRKDFFGIENDIKRDSPEECVLSVNKLSKAIGNSHRDVLLYAALQGEILRSLKELDHASFALLLKENIIDMSRQHAHFLMKFSLLCEKYEKLLQCEVPLNFFNKNYVIITEICEEE